MKMKRDLIQGLLRYPVSNAAVTPPDNRKFFQIIPPAKAKDRLSRSRILQPAKVSSVEGHEKIWQNLRKQKNL